MLFMRGRIFMNQIMLDVKLFASGKDDDILSFDFENNECRVNLNSDSCQSELKKVFSELVMLLLHNDIYKSEPNRKYPYRGNQHRSVPVRKRTVGTGHFFRKESRK